MGISIFPSTAAEFVSNNFVVDMNDSTNNTADTGGVKQAGPYSMSFSSSDVTFDVYLIDEDGNSVGYSNNTSIVASGLFTTVVILGVASDEVISFLYQGSVNNADGEGDEPGAGAYLESISPSDLPSIDDTATVTGGNFASDVQITFESGATVLSAKSIVRNSSTELVVTRPDELTVDDSPYTLKAVNPGVTPPTGTNAHLLVDGVTAGAVPNWVTTSPLSIGTINVAYSETLEATDADGAVTYTVTAGTLPTGLSLDSSTGVISGTPTAGGQTFTVTASDDGGNVSTREFDLGIAFATGGTITTDGSFIYHTFLSTDDLVVNEDVTTVEYLIVAGGGGAGNRSEFAGGGGAGGLLNSSASFSTGTLTCTVGAGGNVGTNGSDSSLIGGAISETAIGGGRGGSSSNTASVGGSGGAGWGNGSGSTTNPGAAGTVGQGFAGGDGGGFQSAGGGGGASEVGQTPTNGSRNAGVGGTGLELAAYASATSTGDSGFYAGGGGGSGYDSPSISQGAGGGGTGATDLLSATAGSPNTGGGGGGGISFYGEDSKPGGSGIVIVRYAI